MNSAKVLRMCSNDGHTLQSYILRQMGLFVTTTGLLLPLPLSDLPVVIQVVVTA